MRRVDVRRSLDFRAITQPRSCTTIEKQSQTQHVAQVLSDPEFAAVTVRGCPTACLSDLSYLMPCRYCRGAYIRNIRAKSESAEKPSLQHTLQAQRGDAKFDAVKFTVVSCMSAGVRDTFHQLHHTPFQVPSFCTYVRTYIHTHIHTHIRVRLKIIGNLETTRDSDLPTFLIISLPLSSNAPYIHTCVHTYCT